MKRLLIILPLALLIGGLITGYYLYNKPHINVSKEKIDIQISIDKIVEDFEQGAEEAITHYSNKIILLQGSFRSLTTSESGIKNLVLEGENQLANCELDSQSNIESTTIHTGDVLSVKGLFVGYDDLLGELQLKKCIIIK